jgi:hypothetical protein
MRATLDSTPKTSISANNRRNDGGKTCLIVWVIKIPDVDDVIMDDPNVFLKRDTDKGSGEHIAPILCGNEKVDMRSEFRSGHTVLPNTGRYHIRI